MPSQYKFKRWKRAARGMVCLVQLSIGLHRRSEPRYFLGVLAVMRNEAPIIREWMEMHLREGVEQFFIVDHQSTDDWQDRVRDFIDRGLVSSVYARGTNLDDVRAEHSGPALASCKWLPVVDLDEFTYARGSGTVADFLRALPDDVAQVKIPWLMFGTSGNVTQPRSVVKHCRRREDVVNCSGPAPWQVKCAIRPDRLVLLKIHGHWVKGRSVAPLPGLPDVDDGPFLLHEMRQRETELLLAQNHYNLQSREQFEEKARRDGYTTGGSARKYSETYFKKTESVNNATEDDRLYLKHRDLFDAVDR